ncbi:lipopolysaccharide biosynthesis protein [Rhizobium tubonense]|uniref:Multi antimicrobial extrusion protein MatE n=1 Tax=Rhizobium tubonense TaxID=484088 RepID=A0A2W4E0P0_9HYPH|nr:lipopolysaccharide biosynthesis protein [Rhizobium tubonense]PZM09456.1 multi antimicrobial extrusion protein MatE [Rhizobium tubonense]
MLPSGLRASLLPFIAKLSTLLSASNEQAASQRMALIAFVIRIGSAALAFVSQVVLARMMGGFEYGIFVFVWVLMVLLGNLSCLGFHTAIIRFLPEYRAAGANDLVRGLTSTARRFALASAGSLAIVGIAALYLLRGMIENYYVIPVFLGLFLMPMIALGDVLDGTARANHWPVMALSPTFLIRPTLILAFMLAAVLGGAPHAAITAIAAALAATFVTTLVQYLAVTTRLRVRYATGPRTITFSPWMAVAFPIFLIEGVGYLLTNSDVIVVGIFLPPEKVAVYFAAAKTMALVHFVYFSVKAAAGPRFSAIIAEGDRVKLAAFAAETTRWTFWPALGVGLAVLAAGQFLLSLFGAAFAAGHVVMAILLAGILAKALVGPGEMLLMMAGHQKLCASLYAVTLAASIGLNLALIPHFGIEGAAIATASAMGVEALLLHIAVRRALGIVLFAFARPSLTTTNAEAQR